MTPKVVGIYGIREMTSDKRYFQIANTRNRNPSLTIEPVKGPDTSQMIGQRKEQAFGQLYAFYARLKIKTAIKSLNTGRQHQHVTQIINYTLSYPNIKVNIVKA